MLTVPLAVAILALAVSVAELVAKNLRLLAAGDGSDYLVIGLYPDEPLARALAADVQAEFDAP